MNEQYEILKADVNNQRVCKTCKHYTFEEIDRGHVCTNADSPYCTEWVGAQNTCRFWRTDFGNSKG